MEQREDHLPAGREVTVNQIVAWNIAWYRHEAGMTQRDLAELLGWPQHRISEAERSWDGKRTREFDAQLIADLAMVFGIPIVAFFLPPDDEDCYFLAPDGTGRDMADLMILAMHDNDDQHEAMSAYRRRFRVQVDQYTDKSWTEEIDRWFAVPEEKGILEDRAAALQARAESSRRAAELDEQLAADYKRAAERLSSLRGLRGGARACPSSVSRNTVKVAFDIALV
jgi:transcriptional regulator with XRE-family HTH domain